LGGPNPDYNPARQRAQFPTVAGLPPREDFGGQDTGPDRADAPQGLQLGHGAPDGRASFPALRREGTAALVRLLELGPFDRSRSHTRDRESQAAIGNCSSRTWAVVSYTVSHDLNVTMSSHAFRA